MTRVPLPLRLFALVACADLLAVLLDTRLHAWPAHAACKALLLPLLAWYAVRAGAPRPLLAALAAGWLGDLLLLSPADPAFLAGMAAFAAGHVCYLVTFLRHGATPRAQPVRLGGGVLVLAAVLLVLWPGLPAGLRLPMAAYSVLLTATALAAQRCGARAAAGGALFLVSDLLIALGAADLPRPAPADFWVMLTYALAQYLLVTGLLRRQPLTSGPAVAAR
ncbi:lysoplasmalogenase family protein [Streptomyces sp. SID11385]|uniref:lysoplasmalogenase family protein n=1 Tax=Streptomyces sp. SID11385 TaxID=2706031 RepID=UPI0013C6919E|nr:lysoplasmalogenase [Streptomyces sp. SID11385]